LIIAGVSFALSACGTDESGDPSDVSDAEEVFGDMTDGDPSDTDAEDVDPDADGEETDGDEDAVDGETDTETFFSCSPSTGADITGSYLLAAQSPLFSVAFDINIEGEEGSYELTIQPLARDDCEGQPACDGLEARDSVGTAVTASTVTYGADGYLSFLVEDIRIPDPAHDAPTSGDLNLDIDVNVEVCGDDHFCSGDGEDSAVTISYNEPVPGSLNATIGAVKTENIHEAELFTRCGNHPDVEPYCGDDDCDGTETPSDCPEDCEPPTCLTPSENGDPGDGEEVEGQSTDGDQLCDADESGLSYDGTACDTVADCDQDGLSDDQELLFTYYRANGTGLNTDITNPNTDGAGPNDGDEIAMGLDPTSPIDNLTSADNTTLSSDVSYSFIKSIDVASSSCCSRRLNDDAEIDNSVGFLFDALSNSSGGPPNPMDVLSDYIEQGDRKFIIEWTQLPDDLANGVSVDVGATIFLDRSGANEPFADREDGDGEYVIDRADEFIPTISARIVDGRFGPTVPQSLTANFTTAAASFYLPLGLPQLINTLTDEVPELRSLVTELSRVGFRGDVMEQTTDDAVAGRKGLATAGAPIEVAAVIPVTALVESLNEDFAACFPDFEEDALSVATDSVQARVEMVCSETSPFDTERDDSAECDQFEDVEDTMIAGFVRQCDLLVGALNPSIDVDTDDDGIRDGLSAGFLIELAGAANTTFVDDN
jgi:hypothetical protein